MASEHADSDPTPTTAEGKAWLDAVRADAADGSLWAYERAGLS